MATWKSAYGYRYDLFLDILSQQSVMIAGTTGSGKSVLEKGVLHTGFTEPIHWVYIDFKGSELYRFSKAPNCIGYAENREQAIPLLGALVKIMMDRFKRMRDADIDVTDEGDIWIVVDETAEFVSLCGKEGLNLLAQLGRMGRAAKMHLLLCTQNPSRSKGGGLPAEIMQNITAAMALRCRSAIESRQIIGIAGAEKLPRYGEGLWWTARGIEHVEIPFVPNEEVIERCHEIKWVS